MKIKNLVTNSNRRIRRKLIAAFSLVEVSVAMGIIGTTTVALFSGFTTGFFTMQMARENLRATQIMIERTETLRLYSWDQITLPGFIQPTFTEKYDPNATTEAQGLTYSGTVQIEDVPITTIPITTPYRDDMRMVTVSLNWKTGEINRNRSFTTYIARNGLQNYIY
jgi:type II secretory pathway pseudopilin PulG